jgi:hypothetical protein
MVYATSSASVINITFYATATAVSGRLVHYGDTTERAPVFGPVFDEVARLRGQRWWSARMQLAAPWRGPRFKEPYAN